MDLSLLLTFISWKKIMHWQVRFVVLRISALIKFYQNPQESFERILNEKKKIEIDICKKKSSKDEIHQKIAM